MIAIAPLLLTGALAAQRPAVVTVMDTVPLVHAAADTVAGKSPLQSQARVVFDFGSGASAPVQVRDFEAGFTPAVPLKSGSNPGASSAPNANPARVRFVKAPDSLTPELARRGASADRFPTVTIEVLAGDRKVMTIRLSDVLVSSDRIITDEGASALEQQRLALEEEIVQLSSDLEDARRQLTLTEALDKKKLSPSLELARTRDRAKLLEAKLDVERRRWRLVDRQLAAQLPVKEEVTLVFPRFEIETAQGARTEWVAPRAGTKY